MTFWMVCLLALLTATPTFAHSNDQDEVVEDNNAFAVALYDQLRHQDGNLFFAPESISTGLAIAYAAASNGTSGMAMALQFTSPPKQFHTAMGPLLRDLNAPHEGYQLNLSTGLWAPKGFLTDTLLNQIKDNYGDVVHQVEANSTAEVNAAINSWVAKQTANKINNLFATRPARLLIPPVIASVAYFDGKWQTRFDKTQTREDEFHVSAGHTVITPLMLRTGDLNYFNGGTFQAVEIPYESKELSMICFLPNAVDGLSAFEQSVTPANTQQWLRRFRPALKVIVTLPKFNVTQQFILNDVLGRMGLISNGSKLPHVLNHTHIDVDESGTEAAAATGIEEHFPRAYQPSIIFRADHPFMFLIRDNRSGGILFMGRITDPSK
jgi:serpin B